MPSMRSVTAVAVVAASLFHISAAAALKLSVSSAETSAYRAFREVYTTNAICSKKHCVNPVFPGMEDLHLLEQAMWMSSSLKKTSSSMNFCRNAVTYDPALPAVAGSIKELVQRQENAAATTFYYHIDALGMEPWDYQKPEYANDCIKSIWRMACFTYFPRAEVGTMDGAYSKYIRPCQSSCMNYRRTCGVECCDESVQCTFSHTKQISATVNVTSEGYLPHDGPSSLCTGGARLSAKPLGVGLWALVILQMLFSFEGGSLRSLFAGAKGQRFLLVGCVLVAALSLQGCAYDVPIHRVGNWRAESDYLIKHEFVPPGGSPSIATVNSCSMQRLSQSLQCSGRGTCVMWNPYEQHNTLAFCECDQGWADPECRTKRKSQLVAYLLSMFFGMFGADHFYLGFIGTGVAKLLSFGGFGVWWVWDIVRIGSAPVYSHNFRTAADLPHWAFVLSCVMFAGFGGFASAYVLTTSFRARKRKDAMLLAEQEEGVQAQNSLFTDAYQTKMQKSHGGAPGGRQQYVQGDPRIVRGGPGFTGMPYGAMPNGMGPGPMGTMGPMPPMGPMGPMPMGSMRMP